MSSAVVPHLANIMFSSKMLKLKRALNEQKRRYNKQPHVVTVYLNITDAYSYLLLQVLAQFQSRFAIEFEFRCVLNKQAKMFPAPALWDKNAVNDGRYLANLYGLNFPAVPPQHSHEMATAATAQLLHWELQPDFLKNAMAIFNGYWQGNKQALTALINPAIAKHDECYDHHLLNNENLLKANGHYLSAMLHYGGEWYWGLDRLQYLERRLNHLKLNLGPSQLQFNLAHKHFCQQLNAQATAIAHKKNLNQQPIEMFWSIRSPYSYIALVRVRELAEHYKVPLVVKPVLPMVMRRMQVPRHKKNYIAFDTKREAKQCGLKFGKISDPLGAGVERCYALFYYAQTQEKGLDYLESYARGVWSQGIQSDTDKGLKKIVERAGLNWQTAKTILSDDNWRNWAQSNLAELYGNEQWGVPSFKYGDICLFGQDRIDALEKAIVKRFSTY